MGEAVKNGTRASELDKPLGAEFIHERSGVGAQKLLYLTGHDSIRLMNYFYGEKGWDSEMKQFGVHNMNWSQGKYDAVCTVVVRLTLLESQVYHEGVGVGKALGLRSPTLAIEKAIKEGFTAALKRAIVQFGEALGLCFYDKGYLDFMAKHIREAERTLYKAEELFQIDESRKPGKMNGKQMAKYVGGGEKRGGAGVESRKRARVEGRVPEGAGADDDEEMLIDLLHGGDEEFV